MRQQTWKLAAAAVALMAPGAGAAAQDAGGVLLADGRAASAASLPMGGQLLIEGATQELPFAGQAVVLDGFTGILGQSAETAYVLVIEGAARIGETHAGPGRVLLIPPYGGAPASARYDAGRLAQQWDADAVARHPAAHAALAGIARRQGRGLFFGTLGRTALNLAAPGGAEAESARRSVAGEAAVAAIRFAPQDDLASIGRSVSERMVQALARGDAASVAALLDPAPYGNTDLTGGGGDARRLAATRLLASHDWPRLLSGATLAPSEDGSGWTARSASGAARIALRRLGDFVFVSHIATGEGA